MVGRKSETDELASASSPNLIMNFGNAVTADTFEEGRSTFSTSDDDDQRPERRRLRKMASDNYGMNINGGRPALRGPSNTTPAYMAPPASRTLVTQGMNNRSVPGGMIWETFVRFYNNTLYLICQLS
jgi:hypothetical protein